MDFRLISLIQTNKIFGSKLEILICIISLVKILNLYFLFTFMRILEKYIQFGFM